MAQKLLYEKDTNFVRNNQLINYCLGDDDELLIESFVHNNGIDLRFDIRHFYFLMTGVHKKFTQPHTPETFSAGVDNALSIYALLEEELAGMGFAGNVFLVKEDNSKQIGVLMTPGPDAACTPEEAAVRLHDVYLHAPSPWRSGEEPYISASFVGPYAGYDAIHRAFLDARALNDLLFFGIRGHVIMRSAWEQTRACDITAIHANMRRLLTLLCSGTEAQTLRQARFILQELVAPSCSMPHFQALYMSFEDQLDMLETVYPALQIPRKQAKDFFTLADYETYMTQAISAVFAALTGAHRYPPTILMALSYIHRNFQADISLTQLAEYVYLNASSLSSEFNAETGLSLSEYVARLRLTQARQLLIDTELPLAEIAAQCGYTGVKYFRESFKKAFGCTPQQMRESRTIS